MDSFGYLIVNSRTALGALPVSGARVKVEGNGTNINVLTDRSGVSERIRLPAPPKELSMSPENDGVPYSTYDVTVEADGFYTVVSHSVPIFPDIVSIQNVNMIPVAGYGFETKPEDALNIRGGVPFGLEGENNDT